MRVRPQDFVPQEPTLLAQFIIRSLTTVWVVGSLLVGAAIALGGPERWSSLIYQIPNQVPGSPYSWACLLTLGGFVGLYGLVRRISSVICAGLAIISAWLCFFATGAVISARINPSVALSGGVWLAAAAATTIILAMAHTKRYQA